MRHTLCLLMLPIMLLLAGCGGGGGGRSANGASQAGDAKTSGFFFVQIADPQLGSTTGNRDLGPDIANLRKAVGQINMLRPAFVVVTGDMTNKPGNAVQVQAFQSVMSEVRSDVPVHYVAGNHDLGVPNSADVNTYAAEYGSDHYAFSYQGTAFIVLDTTLIANSNEDANLRAEQRAWFEGALREARGQNPDHIFVCGHHPWFLSDPAEPDNCFSVPMAARGEHLDLMKQYGADYAIGGHYHREALGHDGCLSVVTTSSLGAPLGTTRRGFRIFKVYPDHVEHTFYPLGSVPSQISM